MVILHKLHDTAACAGQNMSTFICSADHKPFACWGQEAVRLIVCRLFPYRQTLLGLARDSVCYSIWQGAPNAVLNLVKA